MVEVCPACGADMSRLYLWMHADGVLFEEGGSGCINYHVCPVCETIIEDRCIFIDGEITESIAICKNPRIIELRNEVKKRNK